jgi:hypothetical protein
MLKHFDMFAGEFGVQFRELGAAISPIQPQ